MREQGADARGEAGEQRRSAGEVAVAVVVGRRGGGGESHDAEGEV